MPKQFKATEDNCIYFFDTSVNCYRKICDIDSFNELPLSVRSQIDEAIEEVEKNAKEILKNERWKDVDFDNLELLVKYYIDKKSNSIVSVKPMKDDEVPEEVKEHFRKLGYMK